MKINLKSQTETRVSNIFERHNISLDFMDDDTYGDWLIGVAETNIYKFTVAELMSLFLWNTILQTEANMVDDCEWTLTITPYVK